MPKIAIQLPPVDAEDKVEVEVTVNGKKRRFRYRIEVFAWEEYAGPREDRVSCLKRIIGGYDDAWQIVQIGEPTNREISILFEQREQSNGSAVNSGGDR